MIFLIIITDRGVAPPYGLAIETSCSLGSVALGCGGRLMAERAFTGPRRHAVEFVAAVDSLCCENGVTPRQIGEVYVSHGPGSFTGLRMGVAAARTIALAQDALLVAVPTLEVIAQNALLLEDVPSDVAVILDAKRKRVYAAAFALHERRYTAQSEPEEVDPAGFLARQPAATVVLGEGVAAYRGIVEATGLRIAPDELHGPRAGVVYSVGHDLARSGKTIARRDLIPHYIRRPEAEERWAARHGT